MLKTCFRCKLEKSINEFYADKRKLDGKRPYCITCAKQSYKDNYEKLKPTRQAYAKKHKAQYKEYYKEQHKQWVKTNPERNAELKKQDYQKHREKRDATTRANIIKNKDRYTKYHTDYQRNREHVDVIYKLRRKLRNRIYHAIRYGQKKGSAIKDLGCTVQHLKLHLELFWDEGMTWDNWGKGPDKWHIDHVVPLNSFNLTDEEQFKKAVHFTNLQPLWEKDNLSKSDNIIN